MIIKKLKNKFKSIENKIQENKFILQDQIALTQLLKMFNNDMFLPLTTWSISPREVLHICNDLVINKRKSIIEFGSGFSTICIAQLLKINKISASFVSVENDKNWCKEINSIICNLKLSQFVKCIYVPITNVSDEISLPEQKLWYDTNFLEKEMDNMNNIDLVIVDGPFGGTTPYARYSAIPFLKNKLNHTFTIFLDDSSRIDESKILNVWKESLQCKVVNKVRYSILSNTTGFDVTPVNM
jgi:16S rRNA G966 N2-methylase RsmD